MTHITLPDSVSAMLRGLQSGAEIHDESGQLLGHFIPAVDKSLYDQVEIPEFTEEELRRMENEPGGRSLDEILKDLEKRA